NPVTNIEFDVPKSSFVKLTVYDVKGRAVETLVNSELSPGTYKTDWNGTNFSSGVYFYKLESDGFVQTKRMILIK
ncbi:MAG: T9SS type A sorting domain-containing protein, partial [Ignavibacteria bacterium]|nr:T9SS type A sorting domain-containing protein [Ignavibacteria bacterium]